ncbi:MAG: purine-nucleoside phosphorylase [Bacillota bacterium]
MEELNNILTYLNDKFSRKPELGLILGSGLGVLAEEIKNPQVIEYEAIPDFPVSTVEGHEGKFVLGELEGKTVIAMQGRFHYYEGYSMQEIVLPVRVFQKLGVKKLIVTNAAGGINLNFEPGDFVLITDHLNLMGDNPLRGENFSELGERFPDMSDAYSSSLINIANKAALEQELMLQKGIYAGVHGPSYETPAEIRYLRNIGADMVGMSTVPEVIAANHGGMEVLGISCITNMAAGVLPRSLDHKEVMRIAESVKADFISLVKCIIKYM